MVGINPTDRRQVGIIDALPRWYVQSQAHQRPDRRLFVEGVFVFVAPAHRLDAGAPESGTKIDEGDAGR